MLLGKAGRYFGGLLLFIGLLFFILLLSGFSSGFFSHSFAQSAITKIVNYTVSQDQLNSVLTNTNTSALTSTVTPKLNSQISYVNCGMPCLASSYVKDLSGINIGMNNLDLFHYEIISLILAIIGIILIFFSYEKEKKLGAVGKNIISVAIISIVIFYIPLAYIIPFLLSFPVSGYSLRIPSEIFSGFAASTLLFDIITIVVGVILIIIAAILGRMKKDIKQNLGTKLIITQK